MSAEPEPLAKIIRLSNNFGRKSCQDGQKDLIKFFVRLCLDDLLEVLHFGNRRWLTKMERIGRRFHQVGENFFGATPFHRLNIGFKPENGSELFFGIGDFYECLKGISHADLATFPPFLRFNKVQLWYRAKERIVESAASVDSANKQSIEEKCALIGSCLQSIQQPLNDSNLIIFDADINENDPGCFSDHSKLLVYLYDQFLPMFDSPRSLKFIIGFKSDKGTASTVIASILEMPQVIGNQNVELGIFNEFGSYDDQLVIQLPVDAVSNWLHFNFVDVNTIKRKQRKERILRIYASKIQNAWDMYSHLKKAFEEAESHSSSFSLQLDYCLYSELIEDEMLANAKTSEDLFITKRWNHSIEIKRAMKQFES